MDSMNPINAFQLTPCVRAAGDGSVRTEIQS